ncbi:hypothetical protein [Actinomadura sp. J1-007]|uniref:hypothetical protein n=1 Tax=Actinomadura sp. J1-007 TaxID=2661913 RepID=UPI0013693063|nr:hypothetical protein [Actinomadura sp. J1-007]
MNASWVQGRSTSDGWISFPQGGINVYRDGAQQWGTVAADKADINGVDLQHLNVAGEVVASGLTIYKNGTQWLQTNETTDSFVFDKRIDAPAVTTSEAYITDLEVLGRFRR